jgi:hypothetical protein
MDMERLLVVADAFAARAGGVHVLPKITLARASRAPFAISLRTPDGAERSATASLELMHVRGPLPPFGMLRLHDLAASDVPLGSEIWTELRDADASR